jgi:hypothetical protein
VNFTQHYLLQVEKKRKENCFQSIHIICVCAQQLCRKAVTSMDIKQRKSSILIACKCFYSILANMIYWLSLILEVIGGCGCGRGLNGWIG